MSRLSRSLALCLSLGVLGLSLWAARPARAAEGDGRKLATATFAGGCFWCMEPPFDKLPGVVSTTSGYTGGHLQGATYREVSNGGTGHTEAVQIIYDPKRVTYETLF